MSAGPGGFALERSYALAVKPATQVLTRRTVRADRQGREPDAVERPVRRSRAGHRRGGAVGRPLDRARCRGAAQGARPLSVRLLRADHQPRAAAALCQRARDRGASRARHRGRPAHPRRHRAAAGAPGLERLVRPVGRRRRRRLARRLRHRLPDAGARARLCGAGHGVQARARPAAQHRRNRAGADARTAAAISPMRSTCWRATAWRRSATFATSPTPSSTTSRPRSPRRRSPRRSASLGDRARAERVYAAALDAIPPRPALERRPRRLRLGAARCCCARDAWRRKAAGRARPSATRCSASRPRAGCTPYTSTQENAWLVLAARAMAKEGVRRLARRRRRGAPGPALPQRPAGAISGGPLQGHQYRRRAAAGGGLGHRRAADAGAGRRARLQDRAQATTRSTASGPRSPR